MADSVSKQFHDMIRKAMDEWHDKALERVKKIFEGEKDE